MPIDILSHLYYSYDARSEYPYVMVCKKYPMSRFELECESLTDKGGIARILSHDCAYLFDLYMFGVAVHKNVTVPYIPYSKCLEVSNEELDNGRVLSADYIKMTVTDIDLEIILNQYKIDKKAIKNLYSADYDYLPEPIVNHVRDGFYEKCGYEEREEKGTYFYDRCKNRLNGNFGMMYTDPVRDVIGLYPEIRDGKRWNTTTPDVEEALEKFYRSRNSFLCYQWGVWTTAHARYHHQKLIDAFGEEFVYGDTDSAKGTDITGAVSRRIEAINTEIERECLSRKAYYDDKVHGNRLYMGVFVREKDMTDFRSLGAKKYAYVDVDGKMHVTVSGVPHKNSNGVTSADELGSLDNFVPGFVFTKTGGVDLHYHDMDEAKEIKITDNKGVAHTFTVGSNVSVTDSTYTLGLGNDYDLLIKKLSAQ